MKLKLLIYNLELPYASGKYMYVADLLSRNHIDETYDEEDNKGVMYFINSDCSISASELSEETKKDVILKEVLDLSKNWSSNKKNIPLDVRHYWNIRSDMVIDAGIIYFKDRLVVPNSLRKKC